MYPADDLQRLADLHRDGHLSADEFVRAKARVLEEGRSATLPPPIATLNQFRRSRSDRWLAGVCGGLERLTGLASWGWRILFVVGLMFGGCSLAVYAALWLFVGEEAPQALSPAAAPTSPPPAQA
ncbi:PspC domain-containing protein [Inhella proteolytica]|uniref:PspC domain-containing protein n=1 Tax=Inhella proteolytica TaxID=2795029 RepID=A0A931J4F2_9BURK|nr:PspC domain-containing protein [Inhella proteolytica]MBH9576687.1 PspC domain-containing protein [Inhella proteolytica]